MEVPDIAGGYKVGAVEPNFAVAVAAAAAIVKALALETMVLNSVELVVGHFH